MTQDSDPMIDAYIDNLLTPDQRASFEARITNDPALQNALKSQAAIDASLARTFVPPSIIHTVLERAMRQDRDRFTPSLAPHTANRKLLIAAAVALAVAAIWWVPKLREASAPFDPYKPQPWRSFETVYNDSVKAGMKPDWVCKNEEEFATYFRRSTGQRLVLAETRPGIQVFGLSVCNCITPNSLYLLARVDGQPVVVFADRASRDQGQKLDEESPLKLFHRNLGSAVLYELTPLNQPHLLDAFVIAKDTYDAAPGEPSRWERDSKTPSPPSHP